MRRPRPWAFRLWRDQGGGVAVMGAVAGGLICGLAALSVDLGSIALEARRVQGAADLAALSAAMDLPRAGAAAQATARDNLGRQVQPETVTGVYTPDRDRRPQERFTPGGLRPNAARVRLDSEAKLYFGRWILGRETVTVSRSATAAIPQTPPVAAFSIGSRLASLDGGLLNQLLGGLMGSKVSLNLMDYRRLADLDVDLLTWLDALAVDLGVEAGDYDALLRHEVDAGHALRVLETVAGGADGGALGALGRAGAGLKLTLGDLAGIEADAARGLARGLETRVSALDLATTTLELASERRQAALSLDVPAGLSDIKASVAIGERPNRSPWISLGGDGDVTVRTAQTRVYIRVRTARALAGLAQIEAPLLVELAASEARLEDIHCPGGAVDLGVRPGLATAAIGAIDETRLDDFKTPLKPQKATLLSLLSLVTVKARSELQVANTGFRTVRFSEADIAAARTRTVSTREGVASLAGSLIGGMELDVKAGPLGLGLGDVAGAVGALLRPLAPVLDGVVNGLLDLLGVGLGEADVTVHGARCGDDAARPTLVG